MKMKIYLLALIILITACDKNSEPDLPLTDIDGNEYDIVKISSQFWIQENLKTSHYRNGDPIPEITSMLSWSSLTSGAWCWYNNDSVAYGSIYGKLYNWYAVNDPRGLAPEGWHVPSEPEWASLSTSLGGDLVAGDELKETGSSHWSTPHSESTNSSGFTGLPGGERTWGGTFDNIFRYGVWWSSTEDNSEIARYRYLNYSLTHFGDDSEKKLYGFSVRCLKD